MTPELFRAGMHWLEPVRSCIRVVHLNWRGEPLMNPYFEDLLRFYGDDWSATPMHWHTNGLLLTRKRAEQIVAASPPHRLFVSIDGGTRESHERNRGPDTFRPALAGLRNLMKANGRDGPLRVGLYQIDFGVPPEDYDPEFAELAAEAAEWIRVPAVEADGSEGGEPIPHDGACFWAGHALCIDSSGGVSVCVLSRQQLGRVGDLTRDSVFQVLERTAQWRRELTSAGRCGRSQCAGCKKRNGAPFADAA
jgi:MoaA/NifB/PqqE/SkfB family radical SAM enzyme